MKLIGERSEEQQGIFENIIEVGSYWKDFWEQFSIVINFDVIWLEDVWCVFVEFVLVFLQEGFEFDIVKCVYVIKKKCNWSVFGLD